MEWEKMYMSLLENTKNTPEYNELLNNEGIEKTAENFAFAIMSESTIPKEIMEKEGLGKAFGKFYEQSKKENGLPNPEYVWSLLEDLGDPYYQE